MNLVRLLPLFLCFTFLLCNCGNHKQTLTRVTSQAPKTEAGEDDPIQVLINAVNGGDVNQVQASLNDGLDINIRDQEGLPLIHIAIKAKQLAVMELLVENGVNLELETNDPRFYNPALNAWSFLDTEMALDPEIKEIYGKILRGEEFSVESLAGYMFTSVDLSDKHLMSWLLGKGMDPNLIEYSKSGKAKHSILIYLFKRNRTFEEDINNLWDVFTALVDHPDIDLNIKVGKKETTALSKAQSRLKNNEAYQRFVSRLLELGAR